MLQRLVPPLLLLLLPLFSLLCGIHASKDEPCETSPPANTPKLDEFLNKFMADCMAQGRYSGIVQLKLGQYRTVNTFVIPSNFSLFVNGTCTSNIISCDIHAPYGIFVSSGASLKLTTCSVTAEYGNRLFNATGTGSSLYVSNAFLYSSSQLVNLNDSLEAVFDGCTFAPNGGASEFLKRHGHLNLTQLLNVTTHGSEDDHERSSPLAKKEQEQDQFNVAREGDVRVDLHRRSNSEFRAAGSSDRRDHQNQKEITISGTVIHSMNATRILLTNCVLDTCYVDQNSRACFYFEGSGLDSDRSDVTLRSFLTYHSDGGTRAVIEAANVTLTINNGSLVNSFGTDAMSAEYAGIGGVIYFDGSSSQQNVLTVIESKFTECSTPCAGAAIAGCGQLVVLNSTFSDNALGNAATEKQCRKFGMPFGGGAIAWFGNMTMAGNNFQNNLPNDIFNITSCYARDGQGKGAGVVNKF